MADLQLAGADNTALSPAAGDEGRVAGEPAAGCEKARRGPHPLDVFGVGFLADQDHLLAFPGGGDGVAGREHQLAQGAAGTRR